MKWIIVGDEGCLSKPRRRGARSRATWTPLPGALDAVARLCQAGFSIAIATRLPATTSGRARAAMLDAAYARMQEELAPTGGHIEAVFFCTCDSDAAPASNRRFVELLQDIGARLQIGMGDLDAVFASEREVRAAHAAGCATHWIGGPRRSRTRPPIRAHADLAAFADDHVTASGRDLHAA